MLVGGACSVGDFAYNLYKALRHEWQCMTVEMDESMANDLDSSHSSDDSGHRWNCRTR
jgi:threonyl-tRNA synthetase